MQIKILCCFLLVSYSIFGQEIGRVVNGNYSVKLLKSNNLYAFVYSNVNSKEQHVYESFNFPNKETIYKIMMDGFNVKNNHQVVVLTDHDTIVRFIFYKIKGEVMLKINQNNLKIETSGTSTHLNREQLVQLFTEKIS
ncbi:MAG: hypothetical protein ACOH1N_05965 [Lutibacter sp.]